MRSAETDGLSTVQHFLKSRAARSLSIAQVARLDDEEAFQCFKMVRWASTDGEPVCPRCGCCAVYTLAKRKLWDCKGCRYQFSVTAGSIFASRKLPIQTYLLAIAIFTNGAKGHPALQMSRDLDCQYKTAFVLCHKLREAMATETADEILDGEVEVDGAYVGGHVRKANHKENRVDRRLAENQTGKRQVVVIMRERRGLTLPFVFRNEGDAIATIGARVKPTATIFADEARGWDALHDRFLTKRVNHQECYSDGEACTNQAESFFSRLRRAELGIHHRISGAYLAAYAGEMAWRENNRRVSNGAQYLGMTAAALNAPVSRRWKGYWQRNA